MNTEVNNAKYAPSNFVCVPVTQHCGPLWFAGPGAQSCSHM